MAISSPLRQIMRRRALQRRGACMRNMRRQHAHEVKVHEIMGVWTQDESMRMLNTYKEYVWPIRRSRATNQFTID